MKGKMVRRNFSGTAGVSLHLRKFRTRNSLQKNNATIHYHPTPEFYLVLSGSCRLLMNNSLHLMRRGTLVWLAPGQTHVLCEQSLDCLFVIGEMAEEFLRENDLQEDIPLKSDFFELAESDIVFIEKLMSSRQNQPKLFQRYATGFGIGYILQLLHRGHEVDKSELHPGVGRVIKKLLEEKEKTPLPTLARLAGMSPDRLLQLFRQQTGMSLVEYRNRQLVQRFLSYYGNGQKYNITEAAFLAGFGSYAQFYRVFTAVSGYTPRAYQRLGQKGL